MKQLFEDFYYLLFPKDEDEDYKTDIDSPLWVKIVIIAIIGFMCFMVASTS